MKTNDTKTTRAFTRADLAAIIGIIGVLALLAAPKLGAAGVAAGAITCTGNMQQMIRAVHLYATDNADFLPFNNPSGTFLPDRIGLSIMPTLCRTRPTRQN